MTEQTEREIAELKNAVETLLHRTELLNARLSKLEKKLGAAEISSAPRENFSVKTAPPAPPNKISMLDEYNEISAKDDSDERERFAEKYKIIALTCVNTAERLNNLMLPLKFERASSIDSGEYWAVPLKENSYAVLPNVRVYVPNLHFVRAMGAVFKSNFKSGIVYDKIFVQRPAIFSFDGSIWKLVTAGELNLG